MCQNVRRTCQCGLHEVQFHLRDNIMSPGVIDALYCPACSNRKEHDQNTSINDNGWVISFDMEIAQMFALTKLQLDPTELSPAFIFDNGYATWRELYPGETHDITEQRNRIIATKDEDPQGYLETIRNWNIDRIENLRQEGWRKVLLA